MHIVTAIRKSVTIKNNKNEKEILLMQNKLMNYKKSLEKNFIDVKNELYGLNTLISEYICDESGCISETLIDEFIDELCSIRMNKYWHHQYYGISGARTRLLETLLYLSIMAHQNDSKVETFADILNLVDELNSDYQNLSDLRALEDLTHSLHPDGFFGVLFDNYYDIVGHSISEDTHDEVYLVSAEAIKHRANERYRELQHEIIDAYLDYAIEPWYPDEEPSLWTTAGLEEPTIISADETDFVPDEIQVIPPTSHIKILSNEELHEREQLKSQKCEEWVKSLKNPERFIECYKDFRKLFFTQHIDRDELEELFIYFLAEKSKVKLTTDKNFALAYNAINKLKKL